MAAPNARAARGWFGFTLTATTLNVFSRLQVTNNGLLQTFFESAPNGSDHINVWLGSIFAQTASPVYLVATFLTRSPGESKPKSCLRADISGTLKRVAGTVAAVYAPPIFGVFLIRDIRVIRG